MSLTAMHCVWWAASLDRKSSKWPAGPSSLAAAMRSVYSSCSLAASFSASFFCPAKTVLQCRQNDVTLPMKVNNDNL